MTKLLKQAMAMMDELPENSQDTAARQIMRYVEELSEFDESLPRVVHPVVARGPDHHSKVQMNFDHSFDYEN
jgi:hypothetical protein